MMIMTLWIFLIIHFHFVTSASISSGIHFPKEAEEKKLTLEDMEKCLNLGDYLPFFNVDTNEYDCQRLNERGPCLYNHWFVLSKYNFFEGVCELRKCEEGRVVFEGECVKLGEPCKSDNGSNYILNPFGEGSCDCQEDYLPWNVKKKNVENMSWTEELLEDFEVCLQENTRGPCPQGQQITDQNGEALCKDSGCPEKGMIRWEDGECYEYNCANSEKYPVFLDNDIDKLICPEDGFLSIRNFLTFPTYCGKNSKLDNSGNCKDISDGHSKSRRGPVKWNTKKNLRRRIASVYG